MIVAARRSFDVRRIERSPCEPVTKRNQGNRDASIYRTHSAMTCLVLSTSLWKIR